MSRDRGIDHQATRSRFSWPEGKRFAFTIVDDTDAARLANVKPVYDLLYELGLKTTKTVWPLRSAPGTPHDGDTLEDEEHLAWVLELQRRGFEIGYHGASAQSSDRERSRRALDLFRNLLGTDPRIYASHSGQAEAIYWGAARLHGSTRALFALANRLAQRSLSFEGENEASPYFWGDLCRERIEYTRNFTFADIDTLRADPKMPYTDDSKPYVRYWFSSSNAPRCIDFCNLIGPANQERLATSGGACIVYTHFAAGFVRDGHVDPTFAQLLRRLASLPGWFVPASTLLDHLRSRPDWTGRHDWRSLAALQWRWARDNLVSSRGKRLVRRIRQRVWR